MNNATNPPMVSIVIVNYNGKRFLYDCVTSIERNVTLPFEIILVDNNSQDGSVAFARKNFPQVTLIENHRNLGFAKGNNLGVQHAQGTFILFLNNDTVLNTDLLQAIKILEKDLSVGIVGAKMIGRNNEYRLSAGHFPEPVRLISFSSLYDTSGWLAVGDFSGFQDDFVRVDWVEGSFQLLRKSTWERVGGMDENYFLYVEDVDFCRSVKELGYSTVYCPRVIYKHFGGYGQVRMTLLVKGLRQYHSKFSTKIKCLLANLVLDAGLVARLLASAPGAIFGNQKSRSRIQVCIFALMRITKC